MFYFILQGKVPIQIRAILTEILACLYIHKKAATAKRA
jgi:hypothetical protein